MFKIINIIFICIFVSAPAYSTTLDDIDESTLWLTSKYERHFLSLKQAAVLVANTPRCTKLLEATIDLDKTTNMFIFYRVLCRGVNNRTYFEIVDGSEMTILKEEKPVIEKLGVCLDEFTKQTTFMENVERLFDQAIQPASQTEEKTQYLLPFNAKTMQGITLKYQASCTISDKGVMLFDVEARK